MMNRPTGLSFMPPTSGDPTDQRAAASALGPSQRALEYISLHLPRILGARKIAPASLLNATGAPAASGASPESAVLQSMMRALSAGPPGPLSRPTLPQTAPAAPQMAPAMSAGPAGNTSSLYEAIMRAIETQATAATERSGETGPTTPRITLGELAPAAPVPPDLGYPPSAGAADDPYARQAPATTEPVLRRAMRR